MKKTGTRALGLLLALAMVFGLSPGTVRAGEEAVVQISTAAELEAFRDRVNGGEAGLCAVLTADLTLSGTWTPFHPADGYVTSAYAGTFDGGGHTIRGLSVDDSGSDGVGLFGTVNGATIQNLCVEGSVSASNSMFVGGIVGKTNGAVRIENCSFTGSVTSTRTGSNAGAGGIAGRVNGGTVTIVGCANSAQVTGGCAGGILGYCTSKNNTILNCYNTGTVSGTNRTGGIAGQVSSTTSVTNCCTAAGVLCGFGGALENCYDEDNPPPDAGALGGAFTTDGAGNLILTWQAGATPAPKDPHISLTGGAALYLSNSGTRPETTLTVLYSDMDSALVEWTILDGSGVIELCPPQNPDRTNSTQIVRGLTPGRATVQAAAGGFTARQEITVYPFVTSVAIAGSAAVGETVRAQINLLGGGELDTGVFPVSVQWKYLTAADYSAGNTGTSSYRPIPGAAAQSYTIPAEREGDYLSFTLRWSGEDMTPSRPAQILAAAPERPEPEEPEPPGQSLEAAAASLGTIYPVFGRDTNLCELVRAALAERGCGDVSVSVTSVTQVYGGADIAVNGDITYFYADPNTARAMWFGSYRVALSLSQGGSTLETELPVILYWDAGRVRETMTAEILDRVSLDTRGPVTENLTLPRAVDGKTWALLSWTSSHPEVISVSAENQTTPDTLFDPYVGTVRRGAEEVHVTLTAKCTFQFTDAAGREEPIVLYQTFQVTVPPMDGSQAEAVRAGLLARLDAGLAAKGLTDAVTGERLYPDRDGVYTVRGDVQLPTTRDFGVDGKYTPVTVTTDSEALQVPGGNNTARVEVLRPVGADGAGTITISLRDRASNVTASRTLRLRITALSQEEIDQELALMERVKAAYFDGIRGSNAAKDDVRTDLVPFQEVYADDNGDLVWVRTHAERTGRGIAPVPMEGWEDLELWRLFRSSNPNVISHESLTVTRQTEAKAVTVTSRLSSQTLGRYGELYQRDPVRYAQYRDLAPLYYQAVSTDTSPQPAAASVYVAAAAARTPADTIVVRGTAHPESAVPVVETLDVSFTLTGLDGQVWTSARFTGLDEASTVYDVFVKALGRDYTATREKGTYIKAISGPQGTLAEKQYGENSGWMYRVNGSIPGVYMGGCPLRSGDSIQVFYTRDAGQDDPGFSRPSGGNSGTAAPGGSPGGGASGSSGKPDTPQDQGLQITQDPSGEVYTITLPKGGPVPQLVSLPQERPGQLAVLVHADGRETVIKKSVSEGGKLKFLLAEDARVKLADYASPFSDVAEDAWYSDAVRFVSGRGLFAGVGGGRFAPDLPLSRGMLAAVLYCLEEPEGPAPGRPFADVAEGAWYAEAVSWASGAGIVSGYGDGRFGPNDQITREQLALMLFRYAQLLELHTGGRDSLAGFSDSGALSGWAREAVAWAVDSGILSGLPDGTLAPAATATRAEAAAMLQQFIAALLK